MTLTTHAAIGLAIGSAVGSPALGFLAALGSHFLVDMIPHGDQQLMTRYHKEKKKKLAFAYLSVDAAVAVMVLMVGVGADLMMRTSNIAFAAAVIGSIIPDFLVGLGQITRYPALRAFSKFHFFFHDFFSKRYGDTRLSYALIGQTAFVLVVLNALVR